MDTIEKVQFLAQQNLKETGLRDTATKHKQSTKL